MGETPETENRLFISFLQRVEALPPLVLRLWLDICQEVLLHELKQLGTALDVALLFLRFFQRTPPLRCLAVRTNSWIHH